MNIDWDEGDVMNVPEVILTPEDDVLRDVGQALGKLYEKGIEQLLENWVERLENEE